MNKLVEIRNQEFICRERALLDSERRIFWLAKAEEWEQCARSTKSRFTSESATPIALICRQPPTKARKLEALSLRLAIMFAGARLR